MCGFSGIIWKRERRPHDVERRLEAMVDVLHHRGPDSAGWLETSFARIGFRRLAIVDLAGGDQPIADTSGTVQVFLNGEIYNHRELRAELAALGHRFRSHSDVEVVPALYRQYGLAGLERLNGMFALCLCDLERERMYLVRDRLGIKPMYYAETPSGIVFGSELKSILASGFVSRELEPAQVAAFVDLFYTPGTRTLVRGVHKLRPGELAEIDPDGRLTLRSYYSLRSVDTAARAGSIQDEVDGLLADSVRLQLIADVPVGISLSGGLDSSLITMYTAREASSDVKLFTVHFEGTPPDELACATEVARYFDLEHVVLSAQLNDFLDNAVRMTWFSDEPMADPAFYSAMKVAEAASAHVKVMLSGTGADELFAGYGHYALTRKKQLFASSPDWLRRSSLAARAFSVFGRPDELEALREYERDRLPWHMHMMRNLGPAELELFQAALPGSSDPFGELRQAYRDSPCTDPLNRQLYADVVTYLADQLLPVLDRTTMSASIEGRVPYLDHRVVETALRIPGAIKLAAGESKSVLRRLAAGRIPDSVLKRAKLGFPNSVPGWLDAGLAELLPPLLRAPGSLAATLLPRAWLDAALASRESIQRSWRPLYALLILQIWNEIFLRRPSGGVPDTSLRDLFAIPGAARSS